WSSHHDRIGHDRDHIVDVSFTGSLAGAYAILGRSELWRRSMTAGNAGGRVRTGTANFGVSSERRDRVLLAMCAAALLVGWDLSSPAVVHPKDGGPDAAGGESAAGGNVGTGGHAGAGTGGGVVASGGNVSGGAGGNSAGAGGSSGGNGGTMEASPDAGD